MSGREKPVRSVSAPLSDETVSSLSAGDQVVISGVIYTARDAAHKRFAGLLDKGIDLPVDLSGQILYYTGPTPENPKTGRFSAGPTTSSRMDAYTPLLLAKTGLRAMIGKGNRGAAVTEAIIRHRCVYFAAAGGAGALAGARIRSWRVVCYEDLGPEAVYRFEVDGLWAVVAIDSRGNNLYVDGPKRYSAPTGIPPIKT
jgi:fumarate hydratase subunit beta